VKIVLVEPYFELKTPNAIARETGAEVVVMPSSVGGEKGITDYLHLFDYDLAQLTKVLKAMQYGRDANLQQNRPPNIPY
jgi:hypothetical protein